MPWKPRSAAIATTFAIWPLAGAVRTPLARARLGQAQVDLAEAKAAQIRGETVPVAEVETSWRTKPRRSATACLPSRHASKTYRLGRA